VLLVLAMLGTARALRRVGAFAAVHLAVAVGVGAAIGVLAVALMAGVTLLGLAGLGLTMLGVAAMSVMLGMALMLTMVGMLLVALVRLGGLSRGGRGEGEGRGGGNEDGLHVTCLLKDRMCVRGRAQSIRTVAEGAGRRRG